MKYLSNSTCRVFRLFWSISSCSLSFLSKKHLYLSSSSFIRYELKPKASFKAAQNELPKIEKKIYVSHTTYLQKRVQLKWISHKSNASRKMSTNFSFTFKTPDTLLSHYKKTCLATVELLYWIRLCLIIRLISIKWYIVWNRKIIFALKYRTAVFCHKYSQKCTNSI